VLSATGLAASGFSCSPSAAPVASPKPPAAGAAPAKVAPAPAAALPPLEKVATPAGTFLAPPYLQLGDDPAAPDALTLAWVAPGTQADVSWAVETRPAGSSAAWSRHDNAPEVRPYAPPGGETPAQTLWSVRLSALAPTSAFDYRVLKGGKPVFSARAVARKPAHVPFRMVAFGDCADGEAPQKDVAYRVSLQKPDMVLITGDIVYPHGRASEYAKWFWPVYNAETAGIRTGAPLMRSTLFVGVSGNHDLDYANLSSYPDGLAYFAYWRQPLNGPGLAPGARNTPPVSGPDAAKDVLAKAAGTAYPRGANFSFDYGGAHFTVIDSNYYTDWTDPALLSWLEKDLEAAKDADWRFVSFHVPPFSASKAHQEEQWMRVLCPVFEKYGVDVVWSGHVHNYQRTKPLRFDPVRGLNGDFRDAKGRVEGTFTYDEAYDGKAQTAANGVIYVVTGGGGAPLYKGTVGGSGTLQPFTAKYAEKTHSFSVVDVDRKFLTVRQIDEDGKEIDRWTLAKP
jgi:3',5'-cyclic AMP phosphodiesterase CpdA